MSDHAIHIKLDGRTYAGTFKVDRMTLTVMTPTAAGRPRAALG
ncbi:MAG: hypothetical protein K0S56_3622 [Microvirga sp.]|jgi:hypothetical protein|nr:hypothetical protein [Microvirga sp.]